MKNPTIKDVAREAGVSVSTVSYVINNREDMRISEATRKKVLQIINYMNYKPNRSAQTLAGKLFPKSERSGRMAFCAEAAGLLGGASALAFAQGLARLLRPRGYDLIMHPAGDIANLDDCDAVICLSLNRDQFYKLGDVNFCPLIAVDSLLNDPLFFQVTQDFARLRAEAEERFGGASYVYAYPAEPDGGPNGPSAAFFPETTPITDFRDAAALEGRNVLVTDASLARAIPFAFYNAYYEAARPAAALSCADKAINREQISDAGHYVLV
jgi:transcriptional regulator with XRE-family HTH domain